MLHRLTQLAYEHMVAYDALRDFEGPFGVMPKQLMMDWRKHNLLRRVERAARDAYDRAWQEEFDRWWEWKMSQGNSNIG